MQFVSLRPPLAAGLALVLAAAMPVVAQVQFPSNPANVEQCDAAYERARALAHQYQERGSQYIDNRRDVERQRQAACSPLVGAGNNRYWNCIAPYDDRARQLNALAGEAFRQRDAISRDAMGPYNNCKQVARSNERQLEEQRRMAQDNQRRQQQAQQDNERRQREAQADNERRQREYAQAQQQAQQRQQMQISQQQAQQQALIAQQQAYMVRQQADMQRMLAQQQRQEDRQPRVIALIEPQAHTPSTRIVQTPQQAAQSRVDALQSESAVKQQEGQVLRDIATYATGSYVAVRNPDSETGQKAAEKAIEAGASLRATALDRAFNPQGYSDPSVNRSFELARQSNEKINEYRGISPAVTQIQNDASSGTQSIFNNAVGSLDKALAPSSLDQLSQPASPTPYHVPPARGDSPAPAPVSSLDQLAAAPAPSPADACKSLTVIAQRDQCVLAQCKTPQFATHSVCRSLNP